jgi:uncharacterized protein YllA (UPF0747 family)
MMRAPLSRYPGMNKFVLDWLAGNPNATRFLPRHPGAPQPVNSAARPSIHRALIESNKHFGLFTREPLERWQRGETLTIVAGQQVGFAGGPLYTLAKLATLIRIKRDLEAQGTPVTAFFWMATEDHDFDEVAQLNVPVSTLGRDKNVNRQLDLVCMRAVRGADARAAVGSLPVPESLITQLLALYDIPRPNWLRSGITFRDSFAELIAAASGNDVVLVDALLPELRRAGASLFGQIHARHGEIQKALAGRGEELKAAGYNEQVMARDGDEYTLLFELVDGHRQPFTGVVDPERISTSALTRPLLQDFVLRPDVFVGGPAEVAYYAQLSTLHDLLGVTMPRVALRGHALVAPKRIVRFFKRFGIDPADVFTSPDALLADGQAESVAKIRALKEEAKRDLMARIEQIGELALPADHSLAGSIQRSIGHLEYHFEKFAERAVKGLVRKDGERHAAARELVATLFPDRHVQDRVVGWFAYWCVYGTHLVERLVEEIEPDSDHFRIIDL